MTKLLLGETRRPGDAQQARGGESPACAPPPALQDLSTPKAPGTLLRNCGSQGTLWAVPLQFGGGMTMTERESPASPPQNAPPPRHPTRLPAQLLGQGAAMCSSLGVWEPGSCIPLFPRALVMGGEPIVRMRKPRPEGNVTASALPTARVWVPGSQPTVHFWTRGTSQDALCPTPSTPPPHSRSSSPKPAGPSCSGSRPRLLSPLSTEGLSLTRTVQGWGLGRR